MRHVCLTYLLGATPSGAIHGVTDEVHSGRSISPLKASTTSRRRCWPDVGRKRLLPAAGVARGQRSGCEGTHPAERAASAGPEGGCSVVRGRRPSCSPRCAETLRSGHLWPRGPTPPLRPAARPCPLAAKPAGPVGLPPTQAPGAPEPGTRSALPHPRSAGRPLCPVTPEQLRPG